MWCAASAVAALGVSLWSADSALADQTVTSSGPLTSVAITSDLNCSVMHTGDTSGEWYGDTACGTFVAIGDVLYGPASVPAGSSATSSPGYTAFTPVSQSQTGAGTAGSPFLITTTVSLGTSGVTLTERDTYVIGQESYRTDITVNNTAGTPMSGFVYHAGDCYLQDSDNGLGVLQGTAPICKAEASSANPQRIEGFFPLTGGNSYVEDYYGTVWGDLATHGALPNTCQCSSSIDNGAAIAWPASITGGGSVTFSLLTQFSPAGATPLVFSKTADAGSIAAGSRDGYTITVTNSGAAAQTLTTITDTLPDGFSYVSGSSSGATTNDPAVTGQTLTWTGTFAVPAASGPTPGTLTLHFQVDVAPNEPDGTYRNTVTGDGNGATVVGATAVAPITVTGIPTVPIASVSFDKAPIVIGALAVLVFALVMIRNGARRVRRR
jgi:uncharacterized repeat protein (TIGR01451 family)